MSAKAVFQKLRWPLLGLLAASFVIMLVEIAISDYDPSPKEPLEYLALLVGGTLYIFMGVLAYIVLPLFILIGLPWLLITRRRARRKQRETSSRGA